MASPPSLADTSVFQMPIGDPARRDRQTGSTGLTPDEAAHVPVEIPPATDDMRQIYTAFTLYPSLEVSLMGRLGERPSTIIQVGKQSVAQRAL